MTAHDLLQELRSRGVTLEATGDKLRFTPKEAVTPELLAAMRERKPDLLALLSQPQQAAQHRLAYYQSTYGKQTASQWLKHFDRAHAAAVATFPPDRREHALRDYRARYCEGQVAVVIAVHTIALELWAADERKRPYGIFLEAACIACRLDIACLPQRTVQA